MQDSARSQAPVEARHCWYPSQYGTSLEESALIEVSRFTHSTGKILLTAGILRESWRRLANGKLLAGRDTRRIAKLTLGALEEIRIDLDLGESFDLIRIYFSKLNPNLFVGLLIRVKQLLGDRELIRQSQNLDIEIADEIYAKAHLEKFVKCWRFN